eukprot:CAMPEP_0178408528 /NCGR_PEP_ID=MMETSP0689_2-20121128/19989_1 /TAXON_ID=160604 /ORGANISM="Amphidinium massartii, Strain CS-259" /LENGTH=153 /DNA_ID=CAMNT_0020029633 /DNA_START=139 /DNA_END=600 /DNA_ORIENTATION=-
MCIYGISSNTARAPKTSTSNGVHASAASAKAFCAASRSAGSPAHRKMVECKMSGRCGGGSSLAPPLGWQPLDLSAPPIAGVPPASDIAWRRHFLIASTAPSLSSYLKMPALPSKLGFSIRTRKLLLGQVGIDRAAAKIGVQRFLRSSRPASSM